MKYALVTGSTKGIGLAIASALIDHDYFVYMNYSNDDQAAAAVRLDPSRHTIIKVDLSSIEGRDILISRIIEKSELYFDCLVLNAGSTCRKPFGDIGYNDWTDVMNVNVSIPFFIVQGLRDRIVNDGSIIFIGSDMGIYPHGVSIPYGVSKAAVHMLAKSLVKEFASRKIRVNAIAPGFVDTEWQKDKPSWLREKIEGKIALQRFADSDEIANACIHLIQNSYINGAVLNIDGGYNMA